VQLVFDNQFTQALPADPVLENARRHITNAIYSRVQPATVVRPHLVSCSQDVAELIGLTAGDCASPEFAQIFGGNRQLAGMDPHATCYGGHQFGNWAGQLGDGRAINLGEIENANGHFMLQLKGAGPTPYSRTADGLAVLRSSIREYLCSEAMHHMGVPTTRALSLVGTGEEVMRDMLYDGHPAAEPGAVVCRVSPCFVRFGHFQMLAARNEPELLKKFTDFIIRREFRELRTFDNLSAYVDWFNEVCIRTADLMVHWMRVGFVHGVMNTDNMSIIGETIDYGPYGWLEDFDPDWTPNTTDAGTKRYRFSQQPAIAQWNLLQLANALLPLVGDAKPLEEALGSYAKTYEKRWQHMMAAKLGMKDFDAQLVNGLFNLLQATETDMTLFFRLLANVDLSQADPTAALEDAYYEPAKISAKLREQTSQWCARYAALLATQNVSQAEQRQRMNATNPLYVLRNYLAQLAIDDAEANEFGLVNELLDVLKNPYTEQPGKARFAEKRPDWARTRVGCSMLSCSS
jgi:uncharacterized protein YdiU (UPF0061 family)